MSESNHHEVIVIGAGVSGIYQIKRLVDLGLDAIVLEGDADLGGTWYRNRYPGCRFDSESYTYGYSFSQELLDEWHWKERFSSQPENLRYLNFVVDKFDLRHHMQFNSRVTAMSWDEEERIWHLDLENGNTYTARFVITGIGVLTIPTTPQYEGLSDFEGEAFHTYAWPKESIPLKGRRVGVMGTGATGIQIISEIADKVDELFVFQRRPNWSTPLNNSSISDEEMAKIRARYDEIFANCAVTSGGFDHLPETRRFFKVAPEERKALWDKLYDTPGFAIMASNFADIFFDEEANREMSEYVANRIRARVTDPVLAEKLIPKDHGFATQRLPLETRYFEAYNRDNVHLVDLSETPVERFTSKGIQTTAGHYALDVMAFATGFDAMTGAWDKIAIRGVGGEALGEKWRGRAEHLLRAHDPWIPESVDGRRSPECFRLNELPPRDRKRRRLADRLSRTRPEQEHHAIRGACGRREGMGRRSRRLSRTNAHAKKPRLVHRLQRESRGTRRRRSPVPGLLGRRSAIQQNS